MNTWEITTKKLKYYPHFDEKISFKNIKTLVTDPQKVASHSFYPLLHYEEKYQPFRLKNKPEKKSRPIKYACRADSYIYSYYRHKLSRLYEEELNNRGIFDCVLAYRNIPIASGSTKGKCNINFAKDAFDRISDFGNCIVITADISSYFDSIDHGKLKREWCKLLGEKKLPNDHFAVFKNITKYSEVDQRELYERLGYFGKKKGYKQDGFLHKKGDIPTKLCSNKEFREKVVCKGGESLIKTNPNNYGIPQGSPISDVLANLYLIDFDEKINDFAAGLGGFYTRYSDDLLLIIPSTNENISYMATKFLREEIKKTGNEIKIQKKKCASLIYRKVGERITFDTIKAFEKDEETGEEKSLVKMKNGLEYLGFRFDGSKVYLRDKTISKFYRKIKKNASARAHRWVKSYPNKSLEELLESFNYDAFFQKFGKVEGFYQANTIGVDRYSSWTFHTYAKRASIAFGSQGEPILRQIRNYKKNAYRDLQKKITHIYDKKLELDLFEVDD